MVQLEEWREQFEAAGVKVAGMTYDSVELLAAFHGEQSLGYPLLHDEEAEHVLGFDVLNEAYAPDHSIYGIPHPGIFLIDADGVIAAKFAVPGYRQRPPIEDVLKAVQAVAGG